MLDNLERARITQIYESRKEVYDQLADYLLTRCLQYRRRFPNVARIVFSREPKVKTLPSILEKIERCRKRYGNNYQYDDLPDVVAITVLCPYTSDVEQFILWTKIAFDVQNTDQEAQREYGTGHRGFHYIVCVSEADLKVSPQFDGIKCEIQIKTLLQEAFDAKSHDLVYKPVNLDCGEELQKQFALLSASLTAIDGQSEFLKDLILADQRELDLHREACAKRYLDRNEEIARHMNLDPQTLPDAATVAKAFREHAKNVPITREFCKFAAYCALRLDDELLGSRAIDYANRYVSQDPGDVYRRFVRGSIFWALSRFENAFEDLAAAAEAEAHAVKGMNNFVYCGCDCKVFTGVIDARWESPIQKYFQALDAAGQTATDDRNFDTRGYYLIAFGTNSEDIERGREMLFHAKRERKDDEAYVVFFRKHNEIALKRLLKLSKTGAK